LLLSSQFLDVIVETVERLGPESLEASGPLVDRPQPTGIEAVQALLARLADVHQPNLTEDTEVFGSCWLWQP
jgi:hypothetical protein